MNYLFILALLSGAAIATQAGLNSQLGLVLKSPLIAACIAFFVSVIFTFVAIVITDKDYPSSATLKSVPVYLWFTGGILSAFAVSMLYYLIPKIGVGVVMSYALTGQLIIGVIIGHFGWFGLPVKPINPAKVVGVIVLIFGVILMSEK